MGCFSSKGESSTKYQVQGSAPTSPEPGSKPSSKTLDPKDFIFVDRSGETLVKPPGSIDGQQFVVDTCVDCAIYLLDTCDSVTIDDCRGCKIVVGPTTGSVFLRDCESCVVVVACRQFRTRDCTDIDTRLLVATRPIIETSTKMRFGCFDFHWVGLETQLTQCGMSAYGNFWSHIFNFNPESHPEWSFVDPESSAIQALGALPDVPELAGVQQLLDSIDPKHGQPPFCFKTWGERGGLPDAKNSKNTSEGCLVLVPFADEAMAREMVTMTTGKATLVRTNCCTLTEPWLVDFLNQSGQGDELGENAGFDLAEKARVVKALAKGKCLGLEFGGNGCVDAVKPVAEAAGFPTLTDPHKYAEWRYKGVEG